MLTDCFPASYSVLQHESDFYDPINLLHENEDDDGKITFQIWYNWIYISNVQGLKQLKVIKTLQS
jgi:hypothetical protein